MKIQNKCIQTILDKEGRFITYRLIYPISADFKSYLYHEDIDEHDYVISVKSKKKENSYKYFYSKVDTNYEKIKRDQYVIMIKASNFKIQRETEKKKGLVSILSNY